ncbi:Helicase_C domain-containing protein/ResIII domain-containing protein [Cephalotus follicularis]|uniref:Helicase_C domain-containing protein/ResIII domain-containing protein n=1 Tax=Cephalotus follicularis TaxID=3775 RepID=A0A1Q3AQ50_CEPFO|nr:Helicase_C domain-containing protein/ResIII domain-containing protein [Cephalotus follicularis]
MSSTIPLEIIKVEGDDEFDWEAAVRAIDVACRENNNLKDNSNNKLSSHFAPLHTKESPAANCRQSTLDKFISKRKGPNPEPENREVVDDRIESVSCIDIDAEAARTWIYPVNVPLRDYQFAITKTALFSNTLVALPTGLGKTLIAAVVMYNYFRWFPDGKIVFAAPSRPLVMQQIEACHNIVGIPQEWTIDMTGQISPTKRSCLWKTKRVFFVTPQVLEKDIQSGTCLVKYLVCLVIDEAHRALGNYSYCVAVRELLAVPVQLRILALTATPGSKHQTIQYIIDNLQISTLEYRNESDHDVSPYVHNRKIELIEVEMGQDAVDINNWLLQVIRPYVARLCAIGLLQNRDYQTLSPVDLLNSRDKFRQEPPRELPQIKYAEVEAYFGALITLYHIRKLLASHGIRPSYEMLEEKLKQGHFARIMSKNEDIRKVKLLMQQSLSHGAPSPKLTKLLEVLVDHFKTKDPRNSRVIIFSNFRGSVRDIMNALANIGDLVKATEFIGQSSGKALKGQSQKVQQAVLEKFLAGGYNVIVATSIGEEGLDIMEVDLVICFDANVSPLRMIQRMGRTGRKHDGRVVVLACQGSELKGYMRKQANSRAINKHMQNGGMNSFNFHSSPRMIPHIFKPEVQFVELSIQQYVPRGKKVKDGLANQTHLFKDKPSAAETDLIVKYFHPTSENSWRPSLIAFPHFQAIPSRVHKVMHSFRTGILIDMMQRLQGLCYSRDSETLFIEDEVNSGKCLGVETGERLGNDSKDLPILDDSPCTILKRIVPQSGISIVGTSRTNEKLIVPDSRDQSTPAHFYLFGSEFVSVDALGKVDILSVPLLPSKDESHPKCIRASSTLLLNSLKRSSCSPKTSHVADFTNSQTKCIENCTLPLSRLFNSDAQQDMLDGIEKIPETPVLKKNLFDEANSTGEIHDVVEMKVPSIMDGACSNDLRDTELSPRLTNMIKIGVVPQSPINDTGIIPGINENGIMDNGTGEKNVSVSTINNEIRTPLFKVNHVASIRGSISPSPVAAVTHSASVDLTNSSCSKNWRLSSGDKSGNVKQVCKFRRLRKLGNLGKIMDQDHKKENYVIPEAQIARSFADTSVIQIKHGRGKKKQLDEARAFFEEEAELSSETEISDDEDDRDNNSYDDSFIDDRINFTAASTRPESGKIDMMAIYRHSLLSQSPVEMQPNCFSTCSSDSLVSKTVQTPQTESADCCAARNLESSYISKQRISLEAMPHPATELSTENETKIKSRKRKLSFHQSESIYAINLESEFLLESEHARKESFQQDQAYNTDANGDVLDDDQFYEGLDLDAVEAEATSLLKHRSEMSTQKQDIIPQTDQLLNLGLQNSPSFDLGIW